MVSNQPINMKRLFILLAVLAGLQANAQTTLVAWNFPNNPDNAIADGGVAANSTKTIATGGGAGTATFAVTGATTNAATATGWNSGSGTKYWEISFSTNNYSGISISSKQRSSGSGPADFKIQYKVGAAGTYADVTGGTVGIDDNFTVGVVSGLSLPSAADNQSAVYVRWIMTSNTSVNSGTVAGTGTSRIDDIVVQAAVPLPLSLLSFDGKLKDAGVFLQWRTTCENSLISYEIENSVNGTSFSTIASVPARNSGCGEDAVYTYDGAMVRGNSAYRLKVIEENGGFTYSPVRFFRSAKMNAEVHVSPNPSVDYLRVEGLEAGVQWQITDCYGRALQAGIATDETTMIRVDALASGMYFLQSTGSNPIRFVKQ